MILGHEQILQSLRHSHLFNRLVDESLDEVAGSITALGLDSGEIVYGQGEPGTHFYFIYSGIVQILESNQNETFEMAMLGPGDFLGEEALITGRDQSGTAVARSELVLLCIRANDFHELLHSIPGLRRNLSLSIKSQQNARRLDCTWMGEGETLYLAVRKHSIVLLNKLISPLLACLITLAIFVSLNSSPLASQPVLLLISGALLGMTFIWAAWNAFDWSNDYYLLTNRRVIRLEKVAGIYESRQEAPLGTILSVDLRTSQWGRLFGYGDVRVRTYTGEILLSRIAHPVEVGSLVEEQWFRVKTNSRREEAKAMGDAIRRRLSAEKGGGTAPRSMGKNIPDDALESQPIRENREYSHIFTMRFEENGNVTYRKHWFVLIQMTWLPLLCLILILAILGLRLYGYFMWVSVGTMLGIGGVLAFVFFCWFLYQYLDWHNDIYQITAEQIIDLDRKPFGNEEKKSAPIDNILSVTYERLGIIGYLFNFGTVVIHIGSGEFTFDNVFNPSGVQQDIFQRMADRIQQKKTLESSAERERVSDWFAYYYSLTRKNPLDPTQMPEPPDWPGIELPDEEDQDDISENLDPGEGWQSYPFMGVDPTDPDI